MTKLCKFVTTPRGEEFIQVCRRCGHVAITKTERYFRQCRRVTDKPPTVLCQFSTTQLADGKYLQKCQICDGELTSRKEKLLRRCPVGEGLINRKPCKYLGKEVEGVPCKTCTNRLIPAFSCEVHGKCTESEISPGVACCLACEDYSVKDPAEDPVDVFIMGYPGNMGGANTECWHTVRIWQKFGLRVGLIPTWNANEHWKHKTESIGARTFTSKPGALNQVPWLRNATVVSFCNAPFLSNTTELRTLGCKLVWVNCMTWLFDKEIEIYKKRGPFEAFICQSDYQKERLTPELKSYGYNDSQIVKIRGAFDVDEFPFSPTSRKPDEDFVIGKLSRTDLHKWAANIWRVYESVDHPKRKARVMAWSDKLEAKCGKPPWWATTLKAQEEPTDAFLSKIHCLMPINGGARENWPRVGLEAMSAGVPIVAQNRWGWQEMIDHGKSGFLANNDEELAGYGTLLAKDEPLRMELAAAARRRVEMLANPAEIFAGWSKLFESLK